jgi:hypothetical protein
MAETLVPDVYLLVAKMSYSGSVWSQTIHYHFSSGGVPDATSSAFLSFGDFCLLNTPNAGFLETVSLYNVYQTHEGETNVEHPPILQQTYHDAGTHDTAYNGSPIGAALPKDVCVYAKCATSGGRSGKLFIRNLLEESDVDSAVSGSWEFTAGSTRFTVARFAAVVTSTLAHEMPGGTNYSAEQFVVAHLLHTKTGDTRAAYTTPITAVTAIRPVWNKAHR